jgi:hypothetical protein
MSDSEPSASTSGTRSSLASSANLDFGVESNQVDAVCVMSANYGHSCRVVGRGDSYRFDRRHAMDRMCFKFASQTPVKLSTHLPKQASPTT